jgi:tripartite-type tricarboxylate transporter receptor subunit TctC
MQLARLAGACALLAAVAWPQGSALTQTYPAGAITILVPYAAGGSADIVARLIAAKLQDRFGKPVVVENRPGGSEMAATEAVARSVPDGHTVAILSNALAINETLSPSKRYDTRHDLVGVARLIELPFAIMVHPSVPAESLGELVSLAKSRPGQLNYGHLGPGSPHFFTMEWFKRTAGVDIVPVPYRGASPAYAALVTGEVQVIASGLGAATPFLEARQARPLAAMSSKRPSTLPDLPTMAEVGYPDFNLMSWMGVFVRAGTSPAIVQTLETEFLLALDDGDVRGRLGKLGLEPAPMPGRVFGAFFAQEIDRWAKVVKETGSAAQ